MGEKQKHRCGVLGPAGREGLSTCAKQKKLYFQSSFLDGLIDLPTSIYGRSSAAEEAGSQPALPVLMGTREVFHRMTARAPSPCQTLFLLCVEPTTLLLNTRESCVGSEVLQTSLMTGCGSSTMSELLILSQFVTPAHYRPERPCPQPPLSRFVLFAQVMETCSGRGGGQGNICDRWKQWELNTFMILLIGKDEGWVAAVNNTQGCTLKHPRHILQSPAPSHPCHQPPSAVSCVSFQKYLRQRIFRSHCKRSFSSWLPPPTHTHFNGSWQLFEHQLW